MSYPGTQDANGVRPFPGVFGAIFAAIYAFALLPPIYIGLSHQHKFILGLPITLWYMLGTCAVAIVTCAALYKYEFPGEETD